ncbi:hypothetical protein DENIS_2629 [Desulfonema ishimotonii]|uniref:Uncharacterized protein n=1 Tax=Desulfonema ishimotonii TaxID=45657 RepID=A0A401FXG3_9BACT|nr:hypothetical protein DENIS_2629 [Desulfonema ishimotonii]
MPGKRPDKGGRILKLPVRHPLALTGGTIGASQHVLAEGDADRMAGPPAGRVCDPPGRKGVPLTEKRNRQEAIRATSAPGFRALAVMSARKA